MRARAAIAISLLALAAAPPALAAGGGAKPDGHVLWRNYPLKARTSATPAASARPAATPVRTATGPAAAGTSAATAPASRSQNGGGSALLPIVLAILIVAALAVTAVALRRRRSTAAPSEPAAPAHGGPLPPGLWTTAAPGPAPAPTTVAPDAPASATASPGPADGSRTIAPPAPSAPARDARTGERLRAAVDIQRGREWPWPEGSEGLWRCEIAPDPAALSARYRAVLHPPDGDPPRVLAVSSAGAAGGDWQSSAPIEQAVNTLAAQLEAEGWEPLGGSGDPKTRRFCWRRDGAPDARLEATAWSA